MPASSSKDGPRLGNPLRPAPTLQLADDFDIDDVIIDAAEVRGVFGRGGRSGSLYSATSAWAARAISYRARR